VNDDQGITFLSGFITPTYHSDCNGGDDSPNSIAKFSCIEFQAPIEVVVTLEQIGATIHKVANVPFRIGLDVYGNDFLRSSRVYIRDAHSFFEMMEIFTVTAGINWRISEDGAIEVYRENNNKLKRVKSLGQAGMSTYLN
jgi:hypothetical protein